MLFSLHKQKKKEKRLPVQVLDPDLGLVDRNELGGFSCVCALCGDMYKKGRRRELELAAGSLWPLCVM
jgi:hypothetical protein